MPDLSDDDLLRQLAQAITDRVSMPPDFIETAKKAFALREGASEDEIGTFIMQIEQANPGPLIPGPIDRLLDPECELAPWLALILLRRIRGYVYVRPSTLARAVEIAVWIKQSGPYA